MFYIAPWVFVFIIFLGLATYLFALGANLDPDDPNSKTNNTWVTINWVAASVVAVLAIITIPLGVRHQHTIRNGSLARKLNYMQNQAQGHASHMSHMPLKQVQMVPVQTMQAVQQPVQPQYYMPVAPTQT